MPIGKIIGGEPLILRQEILPLDEAHIDHSEWQGLEIRVHQAYIQSCFKETIRGKHFETVMLGFTDNPQDQVVRIYRGQMLELEADEKNTLRVLVIPHFNLLSLQNICLKKMVYDAHLEACAFGDALDKHQSVPAVNEHGRLDEVGHELLFQEFKYHSEVPKDFLQTRLQQRALQNLLKLQIIEKHDYGRNFISDKPMEGVDHVDIYGAYFRPFRCRQNVVSFYKKPPEVKSKLEDQHSAIQFFEENLQ